MTLVIDIDDDLYIRLFDNGENNVTDMQRTCVAVRKGVVIPKGHGRLIDTAILDECKEIMTTISGETIYAVRMDDIRNIPTIIEKANRK